MSLVIHLPPAQETRLEEEARKNGISVSELVQQALAERFPVLREEDAQALALIEQWIAEAPTDPEEVREAERDLREFQQAVNQTRRSAGARIIYPGIESESL
jgi:predicted transcriptional regulator